MSEDDPYSVARAYEQKEHLRRWDAAAARLGLDPCSPDNASAIRSALRDEP